MGLLDSFSESNLGKNLLDFSSPQRQQTLLGISQALAAPSNRGDTRMSKIMDSVSKTNVSNKEDSDKRMSQILSAMPKGVSFKNISPESKAMIKDYLRTGDQTLLMNIDFGTAGTKGKVTAGIITSYTPESIQEFRASDDFNSLVAKGTKDKTITTKREGQYQLPGESSSVFGYVKGGQRYMRVDGVESVMPDGYKKIDKPIETINKLNKFEQTDFITNKVEGMPSYTERARQVALADQTIEVLQSDISKGVPVSERGVSELYNAVGGSKAAVEISRLISGGSLKQRFQDWASKGFSGALSNATSDEYVQLALIARKYAASQINSGIDRIGANFAGSTDLIDTDSILNTYRIKQAEIPMGSVRNAGDASFRYIGGPVGDASSWEGM